MKLYIIRPRLKLYFWLPVFLLRWKWLWKKIISQNNSKEEQEIQEFLPFVLKGIKLYKKRYGHFYLLDVETKDGTKIKIRV